MPLPAILAPAIAAAVSGGMGMASGAMSDKRQTKQQGKLNQIQLRDQLALNNENYRLNKKMWDETNYDDQRREMEKAGLNPAMMYGMGGGGGQSTAGGGGGSISGATAPSGGGEGTAAMGMMLEAALLKAQKENIEADTEVKKVDAENKAGVERQETTARIASLTQGVENAKAQETLAKADTNLKNMELQEKNMSQADRMDYIKFQAGQAMNHLKQAENETFISNSTKEEKVKIIKQEAIGAVLRNALTSAQTGKTKSDIQVNNAQINKMAQDIAQGWGKLEQGQQEIDIKKWVEEIKAQFPNLSEGMGRILNDGFEKIMGVFRGERRGNSYEMPNK